MAHVKLGIEGSAPMINNGTVPDLITPLRTFVVLLISGTLLRTDQYSQR